MDKNEIYRIYGKDYKEMTKSLLNEADLASLIPEDASIGIKPNLVEPVPADFGATTHLSSTAATTPYLQTMELSWWILRRSLSSKPAKAI